MKSAILFLSMLGIIILIFSFNKSTNNKTMEKDTDIQYVFQTNNLKRYQFPTHINDLVVDRKNSSNSEVFMVLVEPEKSVHHHKHDDTEQVFYMLRGTGKLYIGKDKKEFDVKPGDVVRIPPKVLHSIKTMGRDTVKYLCIDCFGKKPLEPTWDEHVKVVCKEKGWNYDEVVTN